MRQIIKIPWLKKAMARIHLLLWLALLLGLLFSCAQVPNDPTVPQWIHIHYQYGFNDELNTFKGTFHKDLILDDSITIPFSFTEDEQRLIIDKTLAIDFFSYPDTLYREPGVRISPDPSPDFLRIKYENQEKRIVWFYPPNAPVNYLAPLQELTTLIRETIQAKPAYHRLPAARGGYL